MLLRLPHPILTSCEANAALNLHPWFWERKPGDPASQGAFDPIDQDVLRHRPGSRYHVSRMGLGRLP